MRWDSTSTGLIAGLMAPLLGFFAYGILYVSVIRPHLDMQFYIYDIFLGTRRYQAPIISLSLIANLVLFFLFDRRDMHLAMRGVITATFLYGVAIVVLWM